MVPQLSRSEFTSFQSPIQELLHVSKSKICYVFKDLLGRALVFLAFGSS